MRKWLIGYFIYFFAEIFLCYQLKVVVTSKMLFLGIFLIITPYLVILLCLLHIIQIFKKYPIPFENIAINLTVDVVVRILAVFFFPLLKLVLCMLFYQKLTAFYFSFIYFSIFPIVIFYIIPIIYLKRIYLFTKIYGENSLKVQMEIGFCKKRLQKIYKNDFESLLTLLQKIEIFLQKVQNLGK